MLRAAPRLIAGPSLLARRFPFLHDVLGFRSQRSSYGSASGLTRQEQLANLGGLVSEIIETVPNGLESALRGEIIHHDVCFRLLPESSHVKIRGRHSYQCTIRLLQLYVRTFLLPPGSKLVMLSTTLTKEKEVDERHLKISWRSQLPAFYDQNWSGWPNAKKNGTAGDGVSTSPLIQSLKQTGQSLLGQLELLDHEYPILAGSFEFAFSHDCTQITVHTISNVEYLPRPIAAPAV